MHVMSTIREIIIEPKFFKVETLLLRHVGRHREKIQALVFLSGVTHEGTS